MRKSVSLLSLLTILPTTSFCLSSCSANAIVIANYESYMNTLLIKRLHKSHNVQFDYYQTNEQIVGKFAKNYDIAFPSSYTVYEMIKDNLVAKFDWTKFNLMSNPERYPSLSQEKITNAKPLSMYASAAEQTNDLTNAINLFADPIREVINTFDTYGHAQQYYNNETSILDYSIPYFHQDWLFGYTGQADRDLDDPNISWFDALQYIMPKGNQQLPRFKKDGNHPRLAMIDDGRSVYDFANIVRCEEYNSSHSSQVRVGVNPPNNKASKQEITNSYNALTQYCKPNNFFLNTDSQQVLYTLGTEGVNGAFSYTGDILYALEGAGNDDYAEHWNQNNFHIVHPTDTLHCMDLLVLNKKDQQKQNLYDIVKTITLEGASAYSSPDKEDFIGKKDGNEFSYGPMLNFDAVAYTPPLYSVYKYCNSENDNYFSRDLEWTNHEKIKLAQDILKLNTNERSGDCYEHLLDSTTKMFMTIDWYQSREKF